MSNTTGSPGGDDAVGRVVVGRAPLAPEPTIAKSARSWPSSIEALADLAADLRLGPADEPPGRRSRPSSCRRPRAARRRSATSSASLTCRRSRMAGPAEVEAALRASRLEPAERASTRACPRRRWSPVERRPLPSSRRDEGGGVVGLLERGDDGGAAPDQGSGAGLLRLQARHDERHRPLARDHQQGQPLHGLADGAGQVAQVRPDADQQCAEAVLGDGRRAARGGRDSGRPGCVAGSVMCVSPIGLSDGVEVAGVVAIRGRRLGRGRTPAAPGRAPTPGRTAPAYLPARASTSGAVDSIARLGMV